MGTVLRLVEHSNKETQAMLMDFFEMSVSDGGRVGLALCFMDGTGAEQCVFTGPYKNPALAMNAAVRMKLQLAEMQDDML